MSWAQIRLFAGESIFYYNDRWQLLESRNGSEAVVTRTVFGTQYVDEIVRWWRDGRGVMIVFQDANWNVVSTADYDGKVLERVRLTPYGQPTFDVETANGDYDGDGDTDSADYNTLVNTCWGNYSGACRIFDYDDNGVIAIGDLFDFLALYPAATTVQRQPGRRTSPNHFPHAHQGLYLDEETMTYQNRHRHFNALLMRFSQPDPAMLLNPRSPAGAYMDGMNLYAYERTNPINSIDSHGLQTGLCTPGTGVVVNDWYEWCWVIGTRRCIHCVHCDFDAAAPGCAVWNAKERCSGCQCPPRKPIARPPCAVTWPPACVAVGAKCTQMTCQACCDAIFLISGDADWHQERYSDCTGQPV